MRRLGLSYGILALILTFACAPPATKEPADMVLTNGNIVTVDETQPKAEAVAVKDGVILAVGSSEDIAGHITEATEVIDLEGQLTIPGFIEGHGHFESLGNSRMIIDLTKARTWNEIVTLVGDAAQTAEPGTWIQGRGWHQEKWDALPPGAVDGMPDHTGLSEVSPDNPVFLEHASGHGAFANAAALKLAGIDTNTPNPPGGVIVRRPDGRASGAITENAQDIVEDVLDEYLANRSAEVRRAADERRVELANADLLSKGITSFHDAGTTLELIDLYREMGEHGRLPVRLYVMINDDASESMDEKLPEYKMVNAYDGHLTVRAIKHQIDGALGSRGAWLLEPYADDDSVGLVVDPIDNIISTAALAVKHGYQLATHAIGDRGNRETLDIYENAFASTENGGAELRWRIEHAQHIHPEDIPRFAELGVIAAMQGNHCTSDAPWVFKRLGAERAESGAYMWRTLLDSGAVVANGTDVPVEDADPLGSFYAAVTRHANDDSIFFPEQVMTREEALESYTLSNAYAAFEEDSKGSITPGKYADITVLSKDIMTVPEEEIRDADVVYTIVAGKVQYRQGSD